MSSETTHKLIAGFQQMAQIGRESSHAHASYCVIRDIGESVSKDSGSESFDWKTVPADSIRQAAQTRLDESARVLESWSAGKGVKFLDIKQ